MPIEKFTQATDVGLIRENNEDAVFSSSELGLWLVADGMGGHAAGEVASKIASETIVESIGASKNLAESIQNAHSCILEAVDAGDGKYGMGSTVVALQSAGLNYQVGWVGDSRAYLFSVASGRATLTPLSTDHSYVQMLFQQGVITEEEMESHPERNIITQCLGSNESDKVYVDVIEGVWRPDDLVLLCSDGLSDIVSDSRITEILSEDQNLEERTAHLVEAALSNGGKDNISVILVAAPPEAKPLRPVGLFSRLLGYFSSNP